MVACPLRMMTRTARSGRRRRPAAARRNESRHAIVVLSREARSRRASPDATRGQAIGHRRRTREKKGGPLEAWTASR